ncbi:DUF1403 family protein [Roseovarius sp.]|uniref:DUF1403 family protein n=1 Tax=Roseovarius sp. TaxID=1486281 RepID=UPI003566B792
MKIDVPMLSHGPDTLPPMPSWVSSRKADTLEDMAFLSGAALAHLYLVVNSAEVPRALLRERLALRAAEACMTFTGRSERSGELRDAIHLLRPGDLPGPAGDIYLGWRRAVERPLSVKILQSAFPDVEAAMIVRWHNAGTGAPVTRAASVLEAVLTEAPRAEAAALALADAALAQALGWDHVVPLMAAGLKPADLNKRGEELRLACHRGVRVSSIEGVRLATDLARRVARLNAVAPKLRAKGAGAAVIMFLTRDAIAPAALPLADRAARRLCERLVELKAVREVTGRDTFRLYGV